jgi:hypothetical protein
MSYFLNAATVFQRLLERNWLGDRISVLRSWRDCCFCECSVTSTTVPVMLFTIQSDLNQHRRHASYVFQWVFGSFHCVFFAKYESKIERILKQPGDEFCEEHLTIWGNCLFHCFYKRPRCKWLFVNFGRRCFECWMSKSFGMLNRVECLSVCTGLQGVTFQETWIFSVENFNIACYTFITVYCNNGNYTVKCLYFHLLLILVWPY